MGKTLLNWLGELLGACVGALGGLAQGIGKFLDEERGPRGGRPD